MIIAAILVAFTASAEMKTVLTVSGANGSKTDYDISQIKKITFDNENEKMTLSHTAGDETYNISDIEEMVFGQIDGVESIYDFDMGNDLMVNVDHGMLRASQPDKMLNLRIFDMNGRLIDSLSANSEHTYDLTALNSGIYIISVNEKAIKFIR